MIGILVNRTLLVLATKSSLHGSIISIESIIEREETFEYNSHRLRRIVNNMYAQPTFVKNTQ